MFLFKVIATNIMVPYSNSNIRPSASSRLATRHAIHEEANAASVNADAGVEPTSAAEGITASQELDDNFTHVLRLLLEKRSELGHELGQNPLMLISTPN